jgi:phage terminase large subunit-like protein
MSHHNVNEAREKAQSYTAHFVWVDEMPNSLSLILELQLRVQANNGRLLCTFTPLLRNKAIKDLIENGKAPLGRKFQFGMLDNPIYKGREQEIMDRYKDVPEDERRARLYGEWFKGGKFVYRYDLAKQGRNPDKYHPSWPHLEVVDPAGTGKAGFMLLANQPGTGSWFVVKAEYVPGAAATDLLEEFKKRTEGYNIVRRVCDPHETWFIKEAAKAKRAYMGVYNKKERKMELIKNLQEALTHERIIITGFVTDLADELDTCMWSESKDGKIVGSSRFHLLDCLQYGTDNLPKIVDDPRPKTHDQLLREANRKRIVNEEARKKSRGRIGRVGRRKW